MVIGLTAVHLETKDRDGRRNLSQGPPSSDQHGLERGGGGHLIRWSKGGMNAKSHAIWNSRGRPLDLFALARRVGVYIGGRALFVGLPEVDWL
jgi:hypothetical protein